MNRLSILHSGIAASAALFVLTLVLLGLQSPAPVATTRAYPGPSSCVDT